MTGGGSGGHITPILAVAHELKQRNPKIEIIYVGQTGDKLADLPANSSDIDVVYSVSAGKLRRYADESALQRLLDVRTQLLNIRDAFRIVRGLWQSYWLLRRLRPDVIFSRGGFVSVPVTLGGHLSGIPYVTHDSDSVPSLANRLIARWAHTHAVALPVEMYPYPAAKTVQVGVPVSDKYQPITPALQKQYREALGLEYKQVVLLTGGGHGAGALNEALVANAQYLLDTFPGLAIVHVAGRAHEIAVGAKYDALRLGAARRRVQVIGFTGELYLYSGAADVVVSRSGATTLAEFAAQGLACIVVPAAQLGWDVKNAQALADRDAVVKLSGEQLEQPERLGRTIGTLLGDESYRTALAHTFASYARPHAAAELADLLINIGGERHVQSKK
ncbi:MAG TPA: glycosyltransferase [Candidatus Saccharimonadia bacterium]|nr:glycosyltransferase [Candidatus Saccharimonadia bacterium]